MDWCIDCSNLTSIKIFSEDPPSTDEDYFDGVASGFKVYVPKNCIEAYEEAWAGMETLPDFEEMDDLDYCLDFYGNEVLLTKYLGEETHVIIPSSISIDGVSYSVTRLDGTFKSSNIISVVIPASVREIGGFTFAACSQLDTDTNADASITLLGETPPTLLRAKVVYGGLPFFYKYVVRPRPSWIMAYSAPIYVPSTALSAYIAAAEDEDHTLGWASYLEFLEAIPEESNAGVASFANKLTISFTSCIKEHLIERDFCKLLKDFGLDIEVNTNII